MEEYKPNSHRYREEKGKAAEPKKIEKVVTGKAKVKKKSEIRKFADVFIPEDIADVKSYIVMDVVVPLVKKAVSDTVDMLLYGEAANNKSKSSKVSYRNYYERANDRNSRSNSRTRARYDYDDVILDTRGEAEEVLERMDELIDVYGMVSVADLYDLAGITCEYTDNKYGWTDIRNASVVHARGGGYLIKLPRALPLD